MKEIITSIQECNDDKEYYSGFNIHTNKQIIELKINNQQNCCECFGYFMSEDNLEEFIGAELYKVEVVDENLKSYEVLKKDYDIENCRNDDCINTMFVNLETNRGTLQFVAYNKHNGYYGHSAYVKTKDLDFETGL